MRVSRAIVAIAGLAGCRFSADPAHADASADSAPGVAHHKVIAVVPSSDLTTLANFPLWVELTDPDLAAHASSDGADIFFAVTDKPLSYEIERWDATTGHLAAWVRIPALDRSTTFELHYGDSSTTHAGDSAAVFIEFTSVWHFSDSLATPVVIDSTGSHHGATSGGLGPSHQVAGKLAGAIEFDGVANDVEFTNALVGASPHTISAWVNQSSWNGSFDTIIALGDPSPDQARFFHANFTAGHVGVGFYADDWNDTGVDVNNAGWTLLHWVCDGLDKKSELYRNGQLAGSFAHAQPPATAGTAGHIGNAPVGFGASNGLPGVLDEVRVVAVARPAAWIAVEFANQSDPARFFTIGPEQTP